MNCYAGLAKRIVKSFFPREIPVPQLQPLDARKIFYASSDEEVWKATLVWAEAKAQEREATALRAVSETNTDESYDSDDSEVGVSIQPVRKSALFGDNDKFNKKRLSFGVISVVEVKKFKKEDYVDDWSKDGKHLVWEGRSAATIIQAAARGRAVRAWNAFVSANKKPSNKPYDAHLASLLAAPVAPPRKPPAALKGKLGNLIFSIPSQPSATKKPSLFGDDDDDDESGCPYPDSDEDEGDGDYGTDDDDFGDWLPPASKLSKTGCPALGDGHHRLFLRN